MNNITEKENKNKKDIILKRKMYYDSYEKEFGDGFYPQLQPFGGICSCANTMITFRLIKYNSEGEFAWAQTDNCVIYGFDGESGIQMLASLNQEANINATKIINSGGRIIYPKIPELSTYRVLEQMSKY
jgi:hypothetical protein